MPLIKSKSQKAFKHNMEAEMSAGKPQKQSLAIAYAVKKKASSPKKMASGGPVSAKEEARPMPDQRANDATDVRQNEGKKPLVDSGALSRPDRVSRKGLKTTPIKHPSMVPSDAISARLRDEEDDLQRSAKVNDGPQEEPPKRDNEKEAMEEGPSTPDLELKKMAEGGQVDSMDQPEPEAEEEHHASIAAAIMARKKMAEGGQVDLDENAMEEPNSFYHQNEEAALKENYDEPLHSIHQPEDSNEHGDKLTDEDAHDMVSRIMKRAMSKKSPTVK